MLPAVRKKKPLTRSEQMARIRGRDTRPEMRLRKALWHAGLRYRLQVRVEKCAPDVVFPSARVAVFVDGCFWHGCPDHYTFPRTRRDFWLGKLRANVERDIRQSEALRAAGWTVIRLWEHEVSGNLDPLIDRLRAQVHHALPQPVERWAVRHVEEIDSESRLERWNLVDVANPATTRETVQVHGASKRKRGPEPLDP